MRYFFVDRITEMVPGSHARGLKNITITEDVFTDHFPGLPIYPGALLIECMAQVGGLLIEKTIRERDERRILPVLITVKSAKFRDVVLPGDSLQIDARLRNATETAAMINASVLLDGKEKASAELFYTLLDVAAVFPGAELPSIDEVQDTLARLAAYRAGKVGAQPRSHEGHEGRLGWSEEISS
jgi:3-hydroxyacyl-[acyl-carrier-protein] dehydratase